MLSIRSIGDRLRQRSSDTSSLTALSASKSARSLAAIARSRMTTLTSSLC
jgi:hypothetical protein